ncbi:hypothetical protein [Marixanthomonas ophiurae]|uniref:Lipoprotein n=1 Tax=Marixanthomonas ophiurae TaxID=387659 RepID=A0A3E1Q9E0_9FLAO|nr:hypothetical protein [Marixanthomonas ophiurae]RFN58742.1 hypothetical protein DZ858_01280 [Marixanthomonas ophiurae]
MKAFFLMLPLLMVNACNTTKTTQVSSSENETELMENNKEQCPENGVCTVEIQKNKQIILKKDEATAMFYPEINDGDNMLVIYTFSQKGPEGTVDGDYSETIHFEIPSNMNELDIKDASLQDVNLLYGKHCYCKGEAGFYKVEKGNLHVTKSNNELHFNLQFTVNKTSHKLSNISKTIQL